MKFENKINLGKDLYLKGRIGWKGLSKNEYLEKSDYLIINATSLFDTLIDYSNCGYITKERFDESPEIILKENDLLISKDGTLGKIGFVKNKTKNVTVASGIFVLRNIKEDILDTTYLYYILKSNFFKDFIKKNKDGSTINHLYQRDLEKISFNIPPLPEQQKIAEILSCWDDGIEKLTKLIELKKQQKKGLMQRLLTNKVRLNGFTQPWKEVKLGEIADIYQPQTISQNMLQNTGYPVYGANGLIGYFSKYNHNTWQTIITCRGSTCGTINRTNGFSWITGNAMVINCDKYKIDKLFLYYKLLSENFSSVISGSGQPQIVRSPLLKWKITIPSNISEQQAIAEILSTADNEIKLLNKKLEALKLQKKGLMQQLLTGKIRVKINK